MTQSSHNHRREGLTTAETLSQCNVFQGITVADLEKVSLITNKESFPAGTCLFREGDRAEFLYLIEDGILNLTFDLKIGDVSSEITIDSKQRGESIGWSALISPYTYTLSGTSRTPISVQAIHGEALREACSEDTELGYQLMVNIATLIGARMRQLQTMFVHEIQRNVSMP